MQIKQTLIGTGLFSDTVPCHLASGLGAGFFAVCIGSPVDVVKSRMMGKLLLYRVTALHPLQMIAYSMNYSNLYYSDKPLATACLNGCGTGNIPPGASPCAL